MTRNYELDCDDLRKCNHEPEVPVVIEGEVTHWLCRCGHVAVPKPAPPSTPTKETDHGQG